MYAGQAEKRDCPFHVPSVGKFAASAKRWLTASSRWSRVQRAQMVDPDRGVDQDHAGSAWRRGSGFNCFSDPPKRAKRFALSRSIKARSASRIRAVFLVTPVRAWALPAGSV